MHGRTHAWEVCAVLRSAGLLGIGLSPADARGMYSCVLMLHARHAWCTQASHVTWPGCAMQWPGRAVAGACHAAAG